MRANSGARIARRLDRVQLRGARRQPDRRHVRGHRQLRRGVPTGAIEDENGVRAGGDVGGDFVDVELHRLGVGEGERQGRAFAVSGADRAEQIGIFVVLVGRLPGPRSAPRPLAHEAVLLTDARFVLEPDFDRRLLGQIRHMDTQDIGEVFLKASTIRSSCLGWRGRALMCEKPSFFKSFPT